MSVELKNQEEMKKVCHQVQRTSQLPEEDTHFRPPRLEDGKVLGAVMVSQGEVVEVADKVDVPVLIEPEPHSEEAKADEI